MFKPTNKLLISITATMLLLTFSLAAADSDDRAKLEADKRALFDALQSAESEQEGRSIEGAIWQFWFDQSPTEDVRASLDAGRERREAFDYEAAENHLDKVVESAPDYAEGYNQRAFVRFLRQKYDDAQTDLETALELEPEHFGAMSGLFHILRVQNRPEAALGLLQQAVEIHPWIQERSMLPEAMWPESYRKIHKPDQGI